MDEKARLNEILKVLNKHHILQNKSPENIRIIFEELGPTFVKIGQILSSRNDYLPNAYCLEFKKLLDKVAPIPYEEIDNTLHSIYPNYDEIFKTVNKKPLGSASIAQTHQATLKNGDVVALKIRRKNIESSVALDFKLIKKVINTLHLDQLFTSIANLKELINELEQTMKEEMNLTTELSHMEEFYLLNNNVKYLRPIKIYNEYSNSEVLVMEYIAGYKISDVEALKAAGYDLNEIGVKLANNYIKQALDDGYYHADPHASNIKILDGKIVYLDFGMMGRLSITSQQNLKKMIFYILTNNYKEIARILSLMNVNDNKIDYMSLVSDIKNVLERNKTSEIANINIKQFISDMYKMIKDNAIILPKDITMLGRGILVISGLLEIIAPDLSLALVFQNYFKSNIDKYINKEDLKRIAFNAALNTESLVAIPSELLSALKGINNNELRFNVELFNSNKLTDSISTIAHQIIIALIDSALIIGMGIIASSNKPLTNVFYIYLIISLICSIYLLYKIISNKITRKK
jgi:ubiquinone biosynthesis protein